MKINVMEERLLKIARKGHWVVVLPHNKEAIRYLFCDVIYWADTKVGEQWVAFVLQCI